MKIHSAVVLFVCLLFLSCSGEKAEVKLAGEWNLLLDSVFDPGKDNIMDLNFDQTIQLPGTLDDAGIGEAMNIDTVLSKDVMNHLHRKHSYVGPAYYSREIQIPESWDGKHVLFIMERVLWKSSVWVDEDFVGSANSLTTAHKIDLSEYLNPGKHRLTICIDNRRQVNINRSDLAHAYTNHTQIKWNGILGDFLLKVYESSHIESLRINPEYLKKSVSCIIKTGAFEEGSEVSLSLLDSDGKELSSQKYPVEDTISQYDLQIDGSISTWSEQSPVLYSIKAELFSKEGKLLDRRQEQFGFRKVEQSGGEILVNGKKVFLRGTLECSIFPLSGHPPTSKEAWIGIFEKAKAYGLNHLRFHSWCPPKAAFEAADELGFYLQAELPNWSLSYGEDPEVVAFMEAEADRILEAYGNHPSFLMFCMGNELMGDFDLINGLVKRLKAEDNRRLYTATAFTFQEEHWGFHEPYDDFYLTQWTDSGWVRGQGVFDQYMPSFNKDYDEAVDYIEIPVISHEIGQYCVYPNLQEIEKYTGVLSPVNFLAVKKDLEKKGRLDMAPVYTEASGKFAAILYKEEIERAYKTEGLSGFQLLDLHDFPGQGTALVGMLDAFWDSKGFISGEEFSQFCSPLVPLIWFDRAVYSRVDIFEADLGLANYSGQLEDVSLDWLIRTEEGETIDSGTVTKDRVENAKVLKLGKLEYAFDELRLPAMLTIELSLRGTGYRNRWQIWVYDEHDEIEKGDVFVTRSFEDAVEALGEGRKVLLSPSLDEVDGIEGKFVPVFWSPVHFPNQPGTMGVLCNPDHAVFESFPTEKHSNWQWWDISKNSKTIQIDSLDVAPLITVMDSFFKNRDLSILFEAKVGEGSLVFSSCDLDGNLEDRLASRQLKESVLRYMNSAAFNPQRQISEGDLLNLQKESEIKKADVLSIYE